MTISTGVTSEERVEILKGNKVEIISYIQSIGKGCYLKEFMTVLLSKVSSREFDYNEVYSLEDLIDSIDNNDEYMEEGTESNNQESVSAQNYFADQTAKMMGTYSRKFN